ncbi:MAG: 16S rRNA (cytosine(967)-C(5))-methyltransferase [Oscillatoriophycideae cyanobacterium NC_groundwater_1537_Pr4_S-0.65um_50_18]|nr:16S rRNA (cytosine(967)-C(5))-methyltransferase [Oscillatoriophycideae cyanobacterium NC_groundwater_1537_Pr4_S-0.65um_50_18]
MKGEARQVAFEALRSVHRGAFADVALDRALRQTKLAENDRRLATELLYGSIRRQRTLDALVDQLATKKSQQQPPDLRLILHLGLYQLRYLNHIPASAAVDTAVELTKTNGLSGLAGFVNGVLRQYVRLMAAEPTVDPLLLPVDPVSRIAVQHSYPDWIVQVWIDQFGDRATEQLCEWLNRSPQIDLRINPLRTSLTAVEAAFQEAGIEVCRVGALPQALRLPPGAGAIHNMPGFAEGWWTVQDSSAQLVSHLLAPQPGETVIDACAAPGGKTTHLAELMQDRGIVWGCDRHASRLRKLHENSSRLQLQSIQTQVGDSREMSQFIGQADRVLVDAPCSGLGTLHRHADARWRQTPETVRELSQLQRELLTQAATWVKPGGVLVYATCTLHPAENEAIVQTFLERNGDWNIERPELTHAAAAFVTDQGWLKVLPHLENMDGFFMVRMRRSPQLSSFLKI